MREQGPYLPGGVDDEAGAGLATAVALVPGVVPTGAGPAQAGNGTAPIEVSSGRRKVYRLSRRGNRRLNHAAHMTAVTQVRYRHSEGRAYYDKKIAEGKTAKEALRLPQAPGQRRLLQAPQGGRHPHRRQRQPYTMTRKAHVTGPKADYARHLTQRGIVRGGVGDLSASYRGRTELAILRA